MVRVAQIGFGGIGKDVAAVLSRSSDIQYSCIVARERQITDIRSMLGDVAIAYSPSDLIATKPDVVIECAGHQAFAEYIPDVLSAGIDVVAVSIGILADDGLRERIDRVAETSGASLTIAPGAIGGLDVVTAASVGVVESVSYVTRKAPRLWRNTAAERMIDLNNVQEPVKFFAGSAREAAMLFPEKCNVTAALALAGKGFDETSVELWADRAAESSRHNIKMKAETGTMDIDISIAVSKANGRSSYLTAMSLAQTILKRTSSIRVG